MLLFVLHDLKIFWIHPHSTGKSSDLSKNAGSCTCHIKQELVSDVNLYIKFFLGNTFCIYTMFKFSKYFCMLVFNPTFTGKNATSVLELAEITPVFKIGLHLRNLGDFH